MIVNMQQMQQQQKNEDTYGNEAKRRRITDAGAHLKVWKSCVISYEEREEKGIPAGEEEEEVTYIVQEPIQVQQPQVQQPQVQVPVQFIGRTVVVETTGHRIHRGKIVSLFDLNGDRAIHIETSDGENLIFTASQMYDLKVLHDPTPVNEEPRPEEVIVIEDDEDDDEEEEVIQITQIMETIHILSDCSSDATTECLDDDQDDFPDVPFQSARQEPVEEEEEEEEPNCCAICFDATDAARNFVSLSCGHQFHFACIMGNMANGGNNRNQCPMCRSDVLQEYDVDNMDVRIDEMVENAARSNQRLQDELNQTRQYREDLTAEYVRTMTMNMQIGMRHAEEREAQDALERRAYICGLNERIATVVSSACNNDVRHNHSAAMHLERQMRELCMCFGMMAYDAQYDEVQDDEHLMEMD